MSKQDGDCIHEQRQVKMSQKCSRERQRTAAGGASSNEECVEGENQRCEWSQIFDKYGEAHNEATRMEYVSG